MLDKLPRDIIKYICIISENHYVPYRLARVSKSFSFLNDEEKLKIVKKMTENVIDYNRNLYMVIFKMSFQWNLPFIICTYRIKINPSVDNYFNLRLLGNIITNIRVITPIKREKKNKPIRQHIDVWDEPFEESDYGLYPSYLFLKEKVDCFDCDLSLKNKISPKFYNVNINDLGETFLYLNCNENKDVEILIDCISLIDMKIRDVLVAKYSIFEIFKGLEKDSKNFEEKAYL